MKSISIAIIGVMVFFLLLLESTHLMGKKNTPPNLSNLFMGRNPEVLLICLLLRHAKERRNILANQ